ncbi:MAG: DnaJ domain-containing protein, partial [Roseicyclus sp.]
GGREIERPRRRLPANIRRALDILGAAETETRAEIRRRYRALVKDLHPDMNGGDRREEARLRRVLWAWDQIKVSRNFPD